MINFLSCYGLRISNKLIDLVKKLNLSDVDFKFIFNSPTINSWHSLSSTSSKERILLLACSSIQTLSQPFLNNLLRNLSASKLMAQWPTDKFVLQSDLDKRCIHLFSNKSSIALLSRNNQLYHYLIVFDIFKKLSYTESKYFKNL